MDQLLSLIFNYQQNKPVKQVSISAEIVLSHKTAKSLHITTTKS